MVWTGRWTLTQATATACRPATGFGRRSSARVRRRNRAPQAKRRSTTHRRGGSTQPRGLRQIDHDQHDAVLGGRLRRRRAGVAISDEGDLDRLAGHLLRGRRQCADRCPVLLAGRGDPQCQSNRHPWERRGRHRARSGAPVRTFRDPLVWWADCVADLSRRRRRTARNQRRRCCAKAGRFSGHGRRGR